MSQYDIDYVFKKSAIIKLWILGANFFIFPLPFLCRVSCLAVSPMWCILMFSVKCRTINIVPGVVTSSALSSQETVALALHSHH